MDFIPGKIRTAVFQDEQGKPLLGHGVEECEETLGNEISRVVKWRGKSDLGRAEYSLIRMTFAVKDADLYSFRFYVAMLDSALRGVSGRRDSSPHPADISAAL